MVIQRRVWVILLWGEPGELRKKWHCMGLGRCVCQVGNGAEGGNKKASQTDRGAYTE